ncbi:DUF3288 family protein [Euhalothece natronophila Z-M001]|uniref:DUF3288 family protein n=1 Tax=Euhalothece natronophila Z-M001 TaxID=522448 RepID=A0A5B8NKE8_9CHRO|nr:DUF3288 family protein [Euhalothece natronophila]QDZ39803.1 DUF3288 family protein [Euhalothece natronophila Z-M001]
MSQSREQKHPREREDKAIVEGLFQGEMSDYNLAELARLRIRYKNFPGANALQRDLDLLLQQWDLTEEELFAKTREIHQQRRVYTKEETDQEDWS